MKRPPRPPPKRPKRHGSPPVSLKFMAKFGMTSASPSFSNTDLGLAPTAGCQQLDSGAILGDGQQGETDEGIPFITVALGEGNCDNSAPFRTTLTSATGMFDFFDLPANTYCLSVSNTDDNETLLAAGQWTTGQSRHRLLPNDHPPATPNRRRALTWLGLCDSPPR